VWCLTWHALLTAAAVVLLTVVLLLVITVARLAVVAIGVDTDSATADCFTVMSLLDGTPCVILLGGHYETVIFMPVAAVIASSVALRIMLVKVTVLSNVRPCSCAL
jgi:hypothetical protein